MAEISVKGFFESLQERLNKEASRLGGLEGVFQFVVGPGKYNVVLGSGRASVSEGEAPSPSCTVTIGESDFLELLSGKLNPQMAFMTGKLKVAGDMGTALKLGSLLKL